MKFAFIVDPLDTLKIYKDSSYAMLVEADARGHELYVLRQQDIAWKHNTVIAGLMEPIRTSSPAWRMMVAKRATLRR